MNNSAEKVINLSMERLRQIEQRIGKLEHEGLRERWEFGRELLTWRVGKKLPAGLLDKISAEIGASRQEIQFRIQFAVRFPDETSLSNGVRQWPTWHQMIQEGLVQKSGEKSQIGRSSRAHRDKTRQRIFALIDKSKDQIFTPKEWAKRFSESENHLLSVIPWVDVCWHDGEVELKVNQELRDICEGLRTLPELNGSIFKFLKELRAEIDRRRKENHDERIRRKWNPDAVLSLEQRHLLNWIEDELDRVTGPLLTKSRKG
jgi:hypothetical protein